MSDRRPSNDEITRAFRAGWAARGMSAVDDVTIHAGYGLSAEIPGPGRYLVVQHNESAPADILAFVRRQVESGTIEGEVELWCSTHRCAYDDGAPACSVWMAVKEGGGRPKPCVINQFSEVLVIPVSDGGSET